MKYSYTAVATFLICVILSACQTAPKGPLPPNDFTFNAPRAKTKEAIVAAFLPRNYQIVRDSDLQLVMDRPANDNFGAQLLFGSQFNGVPNARVMLTFLGDNPTSVNARLFIVTNPGSGFEQQTDITNNADGRASIAKAMAIAQTTLAASK
ncbi:MAG: hypothetical protein E5X72_01620 [Mesorhizobium sp.]|uniref:hypothetical protein n=1 Tax=Mesorhizobium sp. TaxID=1871066 RepID=UPI001227D64C|nr:hypothetical protein [Mesorhizobium sp.]TIP06443.1 MAG: hypothetical protein E5X72_01620 [Mesorhizobium sp.]